MTRGEHATDGKFNDWPSRRKKCCSDTVEDRLKVSKNLTRLSEWAAKIQQVIDL